jgi:hypothetical protein
MRTQRKCSFCKCSLINRSKEHVIPTWLIKYLGVEGMEISPRQITMDGEIVDKRNHPIENLLLGPVCTSCNTGWMSGLEQDVKFLLIALMEKSKDINLLSNEEKHILALWTYKTALTLNLASNYYLKIPSTHFHGFYQSQDTLPERVTVLAQQHDQSEMDDPFFWSQQAFWSIENCDQKDLETLKEIYEKEAYKISFRFKHLILLVAYNPKPEYHFIMRKGVHVPIYPFAGKCGWYEEDGFHRDVDYKAQIEVHSSLMVGKL